MICPCLLTPSVVATFAVAFVASTLVQLVFVAWVVSELRAVRLFGVRSPQGSRDETGLHKHLLPEDFTGIFAPECRGMSINVCRQVDMGIVAAKHRAMAASDRYPPCSECEKVAVDDDVERDHYEELFIAKTPKDLERFDIATSAERHQISVEDVLAQYKFAEETLCSMPRRHRHRLGYVARTRCGLVLSMGSECGQHLIEGFSRAETYVRRATQYARFHEQAADRLSRLRNDFARATELEARIWGARKFIEEEIPMLASQLRERFKIRRSIAAIERIPGIELWDYDRPGADRYRSVLRGLELRSRRDDDPLTFSQRSGILSEIKELERAVADFLAWATAAAVLLTREGMARACEVIDSEVEDVTTSAFDPNLGRASTRTVSVLRRKRDQFVVTNEGFLVDGRRTVPFTWLRT